MTPSCSVCVASFGLNSIQDPAVLVDADEFCLFHIVPDADFRARRPVRILFIVTQYEDAAGNGSDQQ